MKATKTELLTKGQEFLQQAILLLEKATEGDANAEVYLINPLKTYATNEHGFLCSNLNIDQLVNRYQKDGDDDVEIDEYIQSLFEIEF